MISPGRCLVLTVMFLLAACSPASEPNNSAQATSTAPTPLSSSSYPPAPDYVGRWTGVEGMFLDVRPGARPGLYRLTMQYDLDHRATADARLDGKALTFTRAGEQLALRPTDGVATGLKYLAGKKDCLTVRTGEGYCRD